MVIGTQIYQITQDLKEFNVIDDIIPEPVGGAHINPKAVYKTVSKFLTKELSKYVKMSEEEVSKHRYKKFRNIDTQYLKLV